MKIKEKTDSLIREFGKYVSLNVLGMLGLSCYILADTFFISRGLGADGLTALNLAIPIYSFFKRGRLDDRGGRSYKIFDTKSPDERRGGQCNLYPRMSSMAGSGNPVYGGRSRVLRTDCRFDGRRCKNL